MTPEAVRSAPPLIVMLAAAADAGDAQVVVGADHKRAVGNRDRSGKCISAAQSQRTVAGFRQAKTAGDHAAERQSGVAGNLNFGDHSQNQRQTDGLRKQRSIVDEVAAERDRIARQSKRAGRWSKRNAIELRRCRVSRCQA